jgi:Cu(I)/Ag(I) efflux system membrane fusion protein
MDVTDKMNDHLRQIQSSVDIEGQRKEFSNLSNEFYKALKIFGLKGKTAYYQFCPMAFNEKGAFWLSASKEIRNPYYGDQMLTCGEVKEVIK